MSWLSDHTGINIDAGIDWFAWGRIDPVKLLPAVTVTDLIPPNTIIPIVYGVGILGGGRLDEHRQDNTEDRLYLLCEGEIDSIINVSVNGNNINPGTLYAGTTTQSFDFHGETQYYRRFAVAQKEMQYGDGGWSDANGGDKVYFTIKGLKVQRYAANGSKDYDGDTFDDPLIWSQNPIWCLIDFLVNRASKKLDPAYINFAYVKAAADLCDTLGYKLNLIIDQQKKDTEIIEMMLAACRGYITYSTGKMEINLERAWVHPTLGNSTPAHIFDDTSNPAWTASTKKYLGDVVRKTVDNGYRYKCTVEGTTGGTEPTWPTTIGNTVVDGSVTWTCVEIADNIGEGSFNYFQEDVNDVPNKIIVKYIDQEARENVALTTAAILAGSNVTSIIYGDLNGSFTTGTMFIGAESFTVSAHNTETKTLTLNPAWVPQKTYSPGYYIAQGAQTFPEMTAIYNDYDNQDRVKRVIEKEIDGSAIPTYKQAYNIAEYHGRKSVDGNLKANLKGLMDSLKLTVGDVVNLTHALPGWIDAKFRITEASESEDEEIEYTCELYDDSFYPHNDPLPAVNLGTTLPNPYAVPGHVLTPSLSEDGYINTDGSYVPTLTLTYTLPSGDSAIFWDKAKIQISINGGNYSDYGIDSSRGVGYTIDAVKGKFKVGDTVTVKVISINSNSIMADATTAPTALKKINGLIIPPSPPSGLAIEGNPDPNDTTWDGLRFGLTWRKASQTGGAGTEGNLGAGGFVDPYWNGDEYELWVGGACIDSGNTKEARYDYIYGDGYKDYLDDKIAAAHGAVTFKVRRVSLNQASDWSTITITQVAPATPAGLSSDFNGRNPVLKWNKATETDFAYYELILNSRTIKLTDPQYTYSFDENVKDNTNADPSLSYSLKTYDIYGNASSALTGTFTNPAPATPAGLNTVAWIKGVEFAWAKNTETDIRGYSVRTKVSTGAWSSWVEQTENNYIRILTDSEVTAYGAGATIYIEVKAVDIFAQQSSAATASAASLFVDVAVVADGSITAPKIAGGAVGTTQLADAAITTAKIATGAVDNAKLAALAVDAAKLADSAVTSTKIANAAVGSAAIAALAVGTGQIADAAITNAKIEKWILGKSGTSFPVSPVDGESFYRTDLNITYRYATSTASWIAVDYVADAGRIVDGIITSVKIADLAVSNAKIANGTIETAKIGDLQVTGGKIATATITDTNIATATITSAKIQDLDVAKLLAGSITSKAITLALTDGAGDVSIQAGKTDFGDNTAGFILGIDDSDSNKVKLEIGDAANYLKWTGTGLNIAGAVTITSGSGYSNLSDKPTSLSVINSAEGTKLSGIAAGADVTLAALNGELALTGGGLNLSSAGAKVRSGQTAYATGTGFWLGNDAGTSKFSIGDSTKYIKWDGTSLNIRGSLNADDIVAGSIRGIGVYGSTHATKGSYLTASCSASDGTLYLKDTTDFPSSGSGWIIDSTNDRDAFSWTGKTSTTLTGCSGVLAHTVSANNVPVVVPAIKAMVIADVVNEMRFFGDNGNGTIEELATIGITASGSDYVIGNFGSSTTAKWAGRFESRGPQAVEIRNDAVDASAMLTRAAAFITCDAYESGTNRNKGIGLSVRGNNFGIAVGLTDNAKNRDCYYGPIYIIPDNSASAPSHAAPIGTLWVTSAGVLYINTSASTTWAKVGAQ